MTWQILRNIRNKYLHDTDKMMLPDFPVDTKLRGIYKEYRQYLRDCPKLFTEATISTAKVKTFEEWREWKRRGSDY